MGEPEPEGAIGEAEAPRSAGRGNRPEAVPRTEGQNRERRHRTDLPIRNRATAGQGELLDRQTDRCGIIKNSGH